MCLRVGGCSFYMDSSDPLWPEGQVPLVFDNVTCKICRLSPIIGECFQCEKCGFFCGLCLEAKGLETIEHESKCGLEVKEISSPEELQQMLAKKKENSVCEKKEPIRLLQTTDKVLMVKPDHFTWNSECEDNLFMKKDEKPDFLEKVKQEHASWVDLLKSKGISVHLFSHSPQTPDAVFPNNWFSTHRAKGNTCYVLYPMKAPNRRLERTKEIVSFITERYTHLIDLSEHEKDGRFLEGTGSLVMDWTEGKIFAALSQRTNKKVLDSFCQSMSTFYGRSFETVTFDTQYKGAAIYHTNVICSIGTDFAIVCFDVIDEKDRTTVREKLKHKRVLEISVEQMEKFCGNVIELNNKDGQKFLIASDTAFEAFTLKQKEAFSELGLEILHQPLSTLEKLGGGGIRCCIAQLF